MLRTWLAHGAKCGADFTQEGLIVAIAEDDVAPRPLVTLVGEQRQAVGQPVSRLETGVPGVDVVDGFAQGFGGGQRVGSPSMRHRNE